MNIPTDLRKLYRDGRLIPFIGAGVSMSVTWPEGARYHRGPSWTEMVDQAARLLGFESPDLARVRGTDLQILEYFQLARAGQYAELTNWLVRAMCPPDDALLRSSIHRELVAMDGCRLIYTTNYDDYIERAFTLQGRGYRTIVKPDHMGYANSTCEIVKFHGDWNNPDVMVISESQYEKRLKLQDSLDYRLRADILGRALLFLGYSFRDPNVSYLFRLVTEQFPDLANSGTGRRAYIVIADPSDFEVRLFLARNIEVIGIKGQDPAGQIAELLAEVRD